MHQCELVGPKYVSPPFPRIKAGFQRAALKPFGVSFSTIFLHEKKDGAPGGTGSRMKNQLGKPVEQKDCAPGGTGSIEKNQLGKNVERKDCAPEGTGSRLPNAASKYVPPNFNFPPKSPLTSPVPAAPICSPAPDSPPAPPRSYPGSSRGNTACGSPPAAVAPAGKSRPPAIRIR